MPSGEQLTGIAALITAAYAVYRGVKAAPRKKVTNAFQLIDELQEDNNRLRTHLRETDKALWLKSEDCHRRILALEEQVASLKRSRRKSASPG